MVKNFKEIVFSRPSRVVVLLVHSNCDSVDKDLFQLETNIISAWSGEVGVKSHH